MANDILNSVREAEEKCENIIVSAKAEAKKIVDSAEENGKAMIERRVSTARAEGEALLKKERDDADIFLNATENAALAKADGLSEAAEKNRASVIKSTFEKFF